jgi:hypothetical protein
MMISDLVEKVYLNVCRGFWMYPFDISGMIDFTSAKGSNRIIGFNVIAFKRMLKNFL